MFTRAIGNLAGFQVIHKSKEWRIAYHSYLEEVNSIHAVSKWGVHEDSEEVFVLLYGKMMIMTAGTADNPKKMVLQKVEPGTIYVVEQGERHAIALDKNSKVLIVENRDMTNYTETAIDKEDLKQIREFYNSSVMVEKQNM